ncbi:MAG: ribosome biogenesis GTP-binding protein YihA/YsxC [Clostridiales bacterium]|nr:ribosome biogenesis GTP-binding protein YihA/YsxC [Clostridiales bacterium]MDD6873424.1 ribosome biogenesis GTP-binding protein YihA/YsxC [Clostridiales bacterium]MDD7367113.1 ribosome biogenesis GTP-binding protein YihA/YsxC [Clostridiales bacterium]
MVIKKAQFITSLDAFRDYPGIGRPEIAMVGKSNVGKSSMINKLTNNGKLARTSAEPGKTRLINLFSLNDEIVLVDLPGYGFARVSRGEKQRWAGMIEGYLAQSKNLKRVLMLVDMRHQPTNDDIDMVNYLRHYGIPFTVAATKADKLSRAEKSRSIPVICRTLAVQPWEIIPFSSEDGTGRDKLLELLDTLLPAPETETPPQGCE